MGITPEIRDWRIREMGGKDRYEIWLRNRIEEAEEEAAAGLLRMPVQTPRARAERPLTAADLVPAVERTVEELTAESGLGAYVLAADLLAAGQESGVVADTVTAQLWGRACGAAARRGMPFAKRRNRWSLEGRRLV